MACLTLCLRRLREARGQSFLRRGESLPKGSLGNGRNLRVSLGGGCRERRKGQWTNRGPSVGIREFAGEIRRVSGAFPTGDAERGGNLPFIPQGNAPQASGGLALGYGDFAARFFPLTRSNCKGIFWEVRIRQWVAGHCKGPMPFCGALRTAVRHNPPESTSFAFLAMGEGAIGGLPSGSPPKARKRRRSAARR